MLWDPAHDLLADFCNAWSQFWFISTFELIHYFAIDIEIELGNRGNFKGLTTVTALLGINGSELQVIVLINISCKIAYFISFWEGFKHWLDPHAGRTCWTPKINRKCWSFLNKLIQLTQVCNLNYTSMRSCIWGCLHLLLLRSTINAASHLLCKHIHKVIHLLSWVSNRLLGWCLLCTKLVASYERILLACLIKKLVTLYFQVVLSLSQHWCNHLSSRCI